MAVEKTRGAGIEERCGRPGIEERHLDAELPVDGGKLPLVREFARAGHIANGGKEPILHDRTKQNVRTEPLRMFASLAPQLSRRACALADDEIRAAAAVEASYRAGIGDEFVEPRVVAGYDGMKDGDALIVANFRADRVRQLLAAVLEPSFDGFARRRVVRFAAVDEARTLVELGPGTGGTTRAVLRAMHADAKLLAIEINPRFAQLLRQTIADRRLCVFEGSAADLPAALRLFGLPAPDLVLSGIPFSTMPRDVALSILCTVVSRPASDLATVDGGCKTFSGDAIPAAHNLKGYARAVGMEAYVERMSEEHGVVRLGDGANPQIGDRIAFYPIHVCPTVNLSDELIGVRGGRVEQVWPILARGKRT